MELPLDVTARDIALTDKHNALIRDKAKSLQKFYTRITGCRIVIEGPGNHHRTGGPYKVRVTVSVPGNELVVDRQEAEDLDAAIGAAFNAARRQIRRFASIRRGEIKNHV